MLIGKHERPVLDWMKRRVPVAHHSDVDKESAKRPERVMSGKYLSLHKYLVDRYADTVVLTFGQIEDLLGFALPDLARRQQEWWTNADASTDPPHYSDSWILASRTATPNLVARTVMFERTP